MKNEHEGHYGGRNCYSKRRISCVCIIQIQSSGLPAVPAPPVFWNTIFPSGQNVSLPMSCIPGVRVLLVPSPGPVPAKVTWPGAAADGSRSAGPDGPLCTRCVVLVTALKVRHHEWCSEAKCSSCRRQIWNTKAGMTRKWKEKMFPLAAENVQQCLIDSRWSERLDVFLELGALFVSGRSKSNFAFALCSRAARDSL